MNTRTSPLRTSIDILPPWGVPEITATGRHALFVAFGALVLVGLLSSATEE